MRRSVCLAILFAAVFVASLDGANPIQNAIESRGATANQEPPHPLTLTAGWWDYFSVTGDELARRVQASDAILATVLQGVPAGDREAAQARVARIRTNFRALEQVKAQSPPAPPIPSRIKDSYSIDELMTVFRQLRATQALEDEEQEDARQSAHAVATAYKGIDNSLAAYLSLAKDAPERLLAGLQLMADRSAVAVAEEQLRIKRERLESTKILRSHLQTELDSAQARLEATPTSAPGLRQQLSRAEKQQERAQEKLRVAETRMLDVYPDTPLGRAQTAKTIQEAILASVDDALARANTAYLSMTYHLQILLTEAEESHYDLSAELTSWQELIAALTKAVGDWQRTSDREFKRASDDLLDHSKTSGEAQDQLVRLDRERINVALETLSNIQRLRVTLAEAEFLRGVVQNVELQQRSKISQWFVPVLVSVHDVWFWMTNWIHVSLFKLGSVPVTTSGIFRALIIFLIAWLLSRLVQLAFRRMAEQQWRIAKSTFYTLGRLAHYVIVSLGLFIALTSLGLDFTNLALVAGALSVGIGFGLQGIVNNFLSGIIILFEKTLKIGDFLELESGYSGYISEINVRSTILRTNDGIEVVIPNSEIIGNKVVNWTMTDAFRRVHVPFTVAFGTDKTLVKKVVLEAADRVPHTLKGQVRYREPEIQMTKFGDAGLHFELVVWVDARASKHVKGAIADYLWEIDSAFNQHGISIPLPQYDVHLKKNQVD